MTVPYSTDLRTRAMARRAAGETHREIAAALQVAPSCISKWARRERETGSLKPGQIGGRKPRALSGGVADWLKERIVSGPFTLRGLTAELADRGVKTTPRSVWVFVREQDLTFKKSPRSPKSSSEPM